MYKGESVSTIKMIFFAKSLQDLRKCHAQKFVAANSIKKEKKDS